MLRVDMVDDIADDSDFDNGVITARDIRVDHHYFNLVDNPRIARDSPTSSHLIEEDSPMPVIEPEAKPRKKVLFTARVDPSVVETLRAYCEFLNSSSQHHVVEQLLRYAFSRDKEFQAWLEQHPLDRQEGRS